MLSATVKRSGGFPLRYDVVDKKNYRTFWTDVYCPWVDFSHGKLRIFEKMVQEEILLWTQEILKETCPLPKEANSELSLSECLEHQKDVTIDWNREFFETQLQTPLICTFGIDYPQANSLLVIKSDDLTDQVTEKSLSLLAKEHSEDTQSILEAEDFLYAKFVPNNNYYVLDPWGFYVSPRRGIKPSIVTSVLRVPSTRSVAESLAWKRWKKENPPILQPAKNLVPPQALQVERHSCPLRYIYSRFHPSVPFLQDPETDDEHLYTWVGWKTYQKFTDLNLLTSKVKEKAHPIDPQKKVAVKFQLDEKVVPLAVYPTAIKGRRKEKDIQVYFGVASTWSRKTLFDPKHPDYIFQSKLHINKINLLHLSYPSVPQQSLERIILYSPNPLSYKNKNSCMRGKTHSENAIKLWQKDPL